MMEDSCQFGTDNDNELMGTAECDASKHNKLLRRDFTYYF